MALAVVILSILLVITFFYRCSNVPAAEPEEAKPEDHSRCDAREAELRKRIADSEAAVVDGKAKSARLAARVDQLKNELANAQNSLASANQAKQRAEGLLAEIARIAKQQSPRDLPEGYDDLAKLAGQVSVSDVTKADFVWPQPK